MERVHLTFFPEAIVKNVEDMGHDFNSWLKNAFAIGLLTEKGQVFQKVGDDFLKLRLTHFDPLPSLFSSRLNHDSFRAIDVAESDVKHIVEHDRDIKRWIARSLTMMLRLDHMNLHLLENESFIPISTLPHLASDMTDS